MKKYLQIIALLLPILSFCQLDSTYQSFNKETSFQKIYLHNNKFSILGKYSELPQEELPNFSIITTDLKRQNSKKLEMSKTFDNYLYCDNSIDGSKLTVGYYYSISGFRTLVKYNDTGKVVFSKDISSDTLFYATSIIQIKDSSYLLTGYGINSSLKYFGFLLKLSQTGNVLWYKKYEPNIPYSGILGWSIYEQNNAYYLALGFEKAKTDTPYFHQETIIYKINQNGELLKTWKGTDSNTSANPACFSIDTDENLIYSAYRYQKSIFDTLNGRTRILNRPYIICRDKNNLVKWELPIQKSQTNWSGLQTLKKLSDGNYLGLGSQYNTYGNDSSLSAYAIKFDRNGRKLWERIYRKSLIHPSNQDWFEDFYELKDGSFIFIGNSYQFYNKNREVNDYGKREYGWAIRTDKNGEILKESHSSIDLIEGKPHHNVFPNPFINQFKLRISGSTMPLFQIYDLQGQTINLTPIQSSFIENELTINLPKQMPNGLYFLRIQTDGEEKTYKIEKSEF